jgi:predicted site-specific integrase-resolvase
MTRAALYARVSTSGHGQDVGLQLEELRLVAT